MIRGVVALFSSIGWQEMALLFFVGLMLYGRNLPDAGRRFGRVVAQLKRSFHDFKDQIDRDGEVRNVKQVISSTARDVKNLARSPGSLTSPVDALRDLTHEAMSNPTQPEDEGAGATSQDADFDDDPVVEVDAPDAAAAPEDGSDG